MIPINVVSDAWFHSELKTWHLSQGASHIPFQHRASNRQSTAASFAKPMANAPAAPATPL